MVAWMRMDGWTTAVFIVREGRSFFFGKATFFFLSLFFFLKTETYVKKQKMGGGREGGRGGGGGEASKSIRSRKSRYNQRNPPSHPSNPSYKKKMNALMLLSLPLPSPIALHLFFCKNWVLKW